MLYRRRISGASPPSPYADSTLTHRCQHYRFFSAIPLSRYSLNMSRYLTLEKMRSSHSAQRKVELRRLGNRLPLLGKAFSFCKILSCVCCLFVKLRLSPGRVISINAPGMTRFQLLNLGVLGCGLELRFWVVIAIIVSITL